MAGTKQNRIERIANLFEENAGKIITLAELADKFNVSRNTIWAYIPDIKSILGDTFGIAKSDNGKFLGYRYEKPVKKLNDIWRTVMEDEEKKPVVTEKKENTMKNAEGYIDATAGKAIIEVDGPEEGPAFAKAGDVYDCSCSDGSTLRYLILTSFEKFSIGLVLNPTKSKDVPKKYSRRIQAGLDTRFTDIRRVTTKPNKYMTQKVDHLGGEIFDSILKDTVRVFTMNDSDAVSDPDMWNALNAREKDLDRREAHLDERAKDILKQQMEADSIINRSQEMRDMLTQRQIELEAANKELDRRAEAFNKRVVKEQGTGCGVSETEVALLRQKVEIYEKLIFERGISL